MRGRTISLAALRSCVALGSWTSFGLLAVILPSASAQEQEGEPPTPEEISSAEHAPLFAGHEPLVLMIEADFHALRTQDRSEEDSTERPAVLIWEAPDGSTGRQDIQIQTRGIFRLARRNCDFPPLRLNLKKGATKGTVFEGQDKLKMVSVCKPKQDYWEQYVLAEYLVYRMFNLLTPNSFRVRLVRATYTDTSGKDDPFTRYGFLIEDDDAMATRLGGWKVDWEEGRMLHPALQNKDQAALVDIFQYMIGNTDWSGAAMHNMELLFLPELGRVTVPYDFDFSGIVNARYATPDPKVGIRSVRQRVFRGYCPEEVGRSPEGYERVFELFKEKQEEIYDLWRTQEGMEEGRIKDAIKYLDEFYDTLSDPKKIRSRIMERCLHLK